MKTSKEEKMIRIKLERQGILIILIGVLLILTLINLYWTSSLANQLTLLTGEADDELR